MMKKMIIIGSSIFLLFCSRINAQVVVPSTATADASAELDVVSTTKGVLFPSLTSLQMYSIASPATGLIVYNTNNAVFEFYNGTSWEIIGTLKQYPTTAAITALASPAIETGQLLYNVQTNVIDLYNGSAWKILQTNSTITPP
jgi:hypothetical protein